uniref:Uncharacterized protein n=1 Tax=Brassica campestris TaxID=3711 RepID=M4EVN9_BRACM
MIISVIQSLIIGIILSVLVVFLHNQIGWIFSSSEAVIKAVNNLSILLAFTILLNSVYPVLSGAAVGSGWFLSEIGLSSHNLGNYVGGKWLGNGPVVSTLNPANNQVLV